MTLQERLSAQFPRMPGDIADALNGKDDTLLREIKQALKNVFPGALVEIAGGIVTVVDGDEVAEVKA